MKELKEKKATTMYHSADDFLARRDFNIVGSSFLIFVTATLSSGYFPRRLVKKFKLKSEVVLSP